MTPGEREELLLALRDDVREVLAILAGIRERLDAKGSKRKARKPEQEQRALRAPVDLYNEVFGTKLGYTPGNLKASLRAVGEGYTLEQMRSVFVAVKEGTTESARWCKENNREFEYLVRPPYRKAGADVTQGPLDKIANELATGRGVK